MKVGSLFSGAGLLDWGLEQAGLETVWQVEYDDWCREVALPQNFPNTEKFKDVREFGKHNLKAVDVICGGFPCQKLSRANAGRFSIEEYLELWFEQFRIISEILPRYALIENSPELARKGLWRVLSDLASLGYDAEWQNLQASDFYLPHERERLFLFAYSASERRTGDVFFQKLHLEIAFERYADISPIDRKDGFYLEANGHLYPQIPEHLRMDDGIAYELSEIERAVKAYGNGVAVPVAKFLGERILEFDNQF